MKRQSLALAMLAASAGGAHAQSNVTLYGVADAGVYFKQLAGETRTPILMSGGMTTSYWALKATEDMGGGLRAQADISGFFSLKTGMGGRNATDALFSRSAALSLIGNWGTLKLGRQTTAGMLNLMKFSPFADSSTFGPSFQHTYFPSAAVPMMTGNGSNTAADSGWSNAISYSSPNLGGFTGTLAYVPSENVTTPGAAPGRRSWAGLSYVSGPFSAGLVYDSLDRMSLNFSKPPAVINMTEGNTLNIGASYDLKTVKLFAQHIKTDLNNATVEIGLKTTQLGVSVPFGSGVFLAAYARTDKDQTAAADQKRDTVSVGYDYNLSKRTDVYAVVMHDKVTGLASGTGIGLGLRHKF